MADTIFDKIVRHETPEHVIAEDALTLAFLDIAQSAQGDASGGRIGGSTPEMLPFARTEKVSLFAPKSITLKPIDR